MKLNYAILSTGIATALWIAQPLFWKEPAIVTSHPFRAEARDMETEVFGADPETDFIPGVKTGGLVSLAEEMKEYQIIPEEMYLESMEMLARCVEAEAGNQGLEGKRLVVDVILNRVRDKDFPDTIAEVITQEYHFSSYWNGAMERVTVSEETRQAIRMELEEIGYPGVMYFREGDWSLYGTPWKQVRDHYFSTK